jgi:hypothetical protein
MLVGRKGEALAQLLIRLDLAIARAYNEAGFTDEIDSKLAPPTAVETLTQNVMPGDARTLTLFFTSFCLL